jgi:hypothetical protein
METNETPFKSQKEFDDYTNQTAQDMKKELNLDDDARFLDFDVIEQEIYFYIDEDTGARIYDTELMLEEFQDKLNQLTGEPTL